jgi:hypothetical protein
MNDLYNKPRSAHGYFLKLWGSHLGPLTWSFGGGDGIRTHGLYIAKVEFPGF